MRSLPSVINARTAHKIAISQFGSLDLDLQRDLISHGLVWTLNTKCQRACALRSDYAILIRVVDRVKVAAVEVRVVVPEGCAYRALAHLAGSLATDTVGNRSNAPIVPS